MILCFIPQPIRDRIRIPIRRLDHLSTIAVEQARKTTGHYSLSLSQFTPSSLQIQFTRLFFSRFFLDILHRRKFHQFTSFRNKDSITVTQRGSMTRRHRRSENHEGRRVGCREYRIDNLAPRRQLTGSLSSNHRTTTFRDIAQRGSTRSPTTDQRSRHQLIITRRINIHR